MSNSKSHLDGQEAGLAALGFTPWNRDFASVEKLGSLNGATAIDFSKPLNGLTYIGVHYGNGSGIGNTTAFYKFVATANQDKIFLNLSSSSGAVLYSTGNFAVPVPEPATWAMMIGGFGLLGAAVRRRKSNAQALTA